MVDSKHRIHWSHKAFFICSALFVLYLQFENLLQLKIVQWDESRLAVNAAEMSESGNFLVTTFEHHPDHYNTKPPLMIWLQTVSIYIFGLNEFAIRFPSALAGFLCLLMVAWIIYKNTNSLIWSGFGMLVLAGTGGYIQLHGTMTGDFDALLTLFIVLSFDAFNTYLTTGKKNAYWLFVLWQSLAIFTKSAAGFIPFPVWVLLLFTEKRTDVLPALFKAIAISLLPFAAYALVREQIAPGYLSAIWDNDFHGRFSKALEGHTSEWHYYIVNLFDFRFNYWIWLLPIALLTSYISKDQAYKRFSIGFIGYLTFLTIAKTRIHWYDMPLLPLASVVIVLGIYEISKRINNHSWLLVYTITFVLLSIPNLYQKYKFIKDREGLLLDRGHYELSQLMEEQQGKAKYIANWYDAEFYFYTKVNPKVSRGQFRNLDVGDTVLLGNMYKDSLPLLYKYQVIKETGNARKVVIESVFYHNLSR